MGNAISSIFIWVWSNFIGWPREESRFTGAIRICLYLYLLLSDNFIKTLFQNDVYDALLPWFLFIQVIVGIVQLAGGHSINGPTDYELNKSLKYARGSESSDDLSIGYDDSFERQYPGLTWWFRVRENEMSAMTHSEKAKFFVETGALTEESVRNLSKYPQSKRAIERLDFECRRPHKELVNYMRGVKVK